MLAGDAAFLEQYRAQLSRRIFDYIQMAAARDYMRTADGRIQLQGGDYMNIETHNTEPAVMRRMEGHIRFIDIHYLISGEEWIGTVPRSENTVLHESFPERDLYFYSGEKEESRILLRPGRFAVFYPVDLHRPLCAGTSGCCPVRKAVIKIKVNEA